MHHYANTMGESGAMELGNIFDVAGACASVRRGGGGMLQAVMSVRVGIAMEKDVTYGSV